MARKILLVEDNPDDILLTKRAFAKNNLANDIVVAQDGVEALAYLFEEGNCDSPASDNCPEIILLDIKLPKVDGIQVLERIRADLRTKLIPVIMLTSSIEEDDICRSYELHANSYIRKPIDFGQFMEAVRQLGLYWLVLNEPPPLSGGSHG
ncbi:MAG: response regulator [Cyanobacteria bacterium REEB65]|nr:response regulator [Cyanobacteria bacterium REEB65]